MNIFVKFFTLIAALVFAFISMNVLCERGEEVPDTSSSTTNGTGGTTTVIPTINVAPAAFTVRASYDHEIAIVDIGEFQIENVGNQIAQFQYMGVFFYLSKSNSFAVYSDLMEANFDTDPENDVYFFGYGFIGGPYSSNPDKTILPEGTEELDDYGIGQPIPDAVIVNRYGFPNGTYYMWVWANMNNAVPETDISDNFMVSSNQIEITGSGDTKVIIDTNDANQTTDTFSMIFTNVNVDGDFLSIANVGGGTNPPCGDGTLGEQDAANADVRSADEFIGVSPTEPGFSVSMGGLMANFLVNAFTLYQDTYFTPYSATQYNLFSNDDNPFYEDEEAGTAGLDPNSQVERYFPTQTIVHIRSQLSPFGEFSPGKYGIIWYREGATVPDYGEDCSDTTTACNTPSNSRLENIGTSGCDLTAWNTADQMGSGAVELYENEWYKLEFLSQDDVDWFYFVYQ
jgi:hypothetical protein